MIVCVVAYLTAMITDLITSNEAIKIRGYGSRGCSVSPSTSSAVLFITKMTRQTTYIAQSIVYMNQKNFEAISFPGKKAMFFR